MSKSKTKADYFIQTMICKGNYERLKREALSMKKYTDFGREIECRLAKLSEVQQWGSTHIKPVIMKGYKRRVVKGIIYDQVYFNGHDHYQYTRTYPMYNPRKIGFFKGICIMIGWCK